MKKKTSFLLKLFVLTPLALYLVLGLSALHGHGILRPEISVLVRDERGNPLQGVEMVFLNLFDEKQWRVVEDCTDKELAEEWRRTILEKLTVTQSDDHGHAVLKGYFRHTAYIWHTYVRQEGTVLLTKAGYLPSEVTFLERRWRRRIRRERVSIEVILRKDPSSPYWNQP